MPTYDYECQSCGHVFEFFQRMSDDPLSECPKCGKGVKRLIGGGMGIIFKGSGFYVTDNRAASKSGGSGSGASASSDSGTTPAKEKSAPKSESSGSSDGKGSVKKENT